MISVILCHQCISINTKNEANNIGIKNNSYGIISTAVIHINSIANSVLYIIVNITSQVSLQPFNVRVWRCHYIRQIDNRSARLSRDVSVYLNHAENQPGKPSMVSSEHQSQGAIMSAK